MSSARSDIRKSTRPASVLIGAMTSVLFVAGCMPHTAPPAPVEQKPPEDPAQLQPVKMPAINPDEGPRAIFSRPLQRLIVEFRVHVITAPKGSFAGSSALWSIATGPLWSADGALRLNANGFRASIGRESDRQALMDFLDRVQGVRMKMDQVTPDVDKPVILELGPCAPWFSAFYYDRHGSLHGLDFNGASARFLLGFEMRSTNLKEVWVRLTPEIEEPPGPMKWQRNAEGQFVELPEDRRTTFHDVDVEAQIPEGGFLIVGGAPALERIPVLGRVFFTDMPPPIPISAPAATTQASSEPRSQSEIGTSRDRVYIISPIVRFADSRGAAAP